MRRRWLIVWVTFALMGCTLIIGLIIHERFYAAPPKDDTCHSFECINAAAQILDFIDIETNPCDNFYKFACGNFFKSVVIPDDADEISTMSIMNENLQRKLRECLEEPIDANEIRAFRIVKTYYRACINTEGVARRGMDDLLGIIQELGGWPVLIDASFLDYQSSEWYIYMYKFRKLGLSTDIIVKLDIDHDVRNSTFYKLKLGKPSFTLPTELLINNNENEYVDEYRRFMINAAVYLGADHYRAVRELGKALDFEMKLAAITVAQEDYLNSSLINVIVSIRELEENYPSIPWYEYISTLIELQAPITRNEQIIIPSTEYLEKLEELLAITPKRDLVNYLIWKAIESLGPYLTNTFRKLELKFQANINGNVANEPRWKECVREVYNSLPVALSAKYVRSAVNDETVAQVSEIAKSIRNEFVDRLKIKKWENRDQKIMSLEKLASLVSIIGFPEEFFVDEKLNELHQEIDVSENNYLLSHLNITRAMQNLNFQNLRRLKSKIAWLREGAVADVVASYDSFSNTMRVPAGLFQGTFFNKFLPKYVNYAGIGFVIGRQIGRALYGEDRDLQECFANQFSNFTVDSINEMVNGLASVKNNIADSVGLRYSYSAYRNRTRAKKIKLTEGRLSGLSYTPEQLFWITFAINQCSNMRVQHLKLWMARHSTAPAEFRVIGSLQNIPDFSSDFECPGDSAMTSEDHCAVW